MEKVISMYLPDQAKGTKYIEIFLKNYHVFKIANFWDEIL